jgi:hypothetical protein
MKSLKVLILTVSLLYPACSTIQGAEPLKRGAGDNIKNIDIELNGDTTVVLKTADNSFEVSEYKYSGLENDPLSIKENGDTIKLKLKQKWSERHASFKASLVLTIPKGKDVNIACGSCSFSGAIDVESLDLAAGNLDLNLKLSADGPVDIASGHADIDLDFDKCETLDIASGFASGQVSVPYKTEVNIAPFWNHVRVARK